MTKEELKQYIDENIYENQDGDITGEGLNEVLKAIVDDAGTKVEANPTGTPTETMQTIKIGEKIYTAPQGPQGEPGEDGQDGQPGAPGPANTLTIGTVTDGEQAAASIIGEAPNQTLNLVLPKGEQGDPGQNAVNPFKGWFTTDNIPTTGQAGDYCNVSNTSVTPHTVTIYRWSTANNRFKDTGEVPDTATGETFASSETLQEVAIDDSHLENPTNTANDTQPVLAKAEDVMQLKVKLEGVTASEEKFVNYTSVSGCWGKEAQEIVNTAWSRAEILLPSSAKKVRILGVAFRNGLSEANKNVANILGHYEGDAWISDYIQPMDTNTEDVNITREYTYAIPPQSTHFRINTRYGSAVMPESSFYCYLRSGESVSDVMKRLSDKTLTSKIKMLPAVKEIGLSLIGEGQMFINSQVSKTWFAFLKAGERITVSNSFSISTYVCVGTASINEPPHIVEQGGSMDAFPKLQKGYVVGDYSYEFIASENCYFWITYRFEQGDPTFIKICNLKEKKSGLLLGSPSLHWSEFTGTDETISSKMAADVYAIYDELVISHPLWLERVDNIGYATLDSSLEIRHYVLGYQKATLQSSYEGANILYDDNGVNHDMPHIVISAGLHGDEKASVWGVARACKEIIESNEPWAVFIKTNFVIDIIPIVSPYTFNHNVRNMTVDGVSIDPNRDYSTFTLNESKAMRDFMLQTKAVCFIDCHNTRNAPTKERMFLSTPEGSMNAETANHLCMRLSSLMSMLIPESYPYPEDPKVYFLLSKATIAKTTTLAYFMGEMNEILSFTMESPRNNEFNAPTNDCTLKASVLMTTLIENVIPALSVLSE